MKIIIDTHILLWSLSGDKKLSVKAAKLLKDPANEILVSAVSLWEIAIKHGLGRLAYSAAQIIEASAATGFKELPISFAHCKRLSSLPSIHQDPFDRLLVAQSLSEPAILLTQDELLRGYGTTVMLV